MLPYCGGGSLAGVPVVPPPRPTALKLPRTGEEVEMGAMVEEVVTSDVAKDVMETVVGPAKVVVESKVVDEAVEPEEVEDVTETVAELAKVVVDSVAESKVVDETAESEEVEDVTGTDEVADGAEVSDVSSEVDELMVTALLILAGGFL